jgi:hypothetical protein
MTSFWKFTFTGLGAGLAFGCLLYPISGNPSVLGGVTAVGATVGIVLGVVHKNDKESRS